MWKIFNHETIGSLRFFAILTLLFNNIGECHKKQKEIAKDIKKYISLTIKEDIWFVPKKRLKKHLASQKYIDFDLGVDKGKGKIRIVCYDRKDKERRDLLYVALASSEFTLYLQKKASQ